MDESMFTMALDIFETGRYPVVRHVFFGKTPERVRQVLAAHRKSDRFLKDCMDKGRYDQVKCSVKIGGIRRRR